MVTLSHEVECDEAYVIAGHKGQPEVVKQKGRKGRRHRLKGPCGRGTLEKERPLVLGMMPRGGQVVLNLLANVRQKTIEPFSKDTIVAGTRVYTDDTAFMPVCRPGETSISVSTMAEANALEMPMATVFVKCR